ncbi:MAG TPA: methyltransferase, partial [Dehalococcoidia bacterium]|nr:methyltransferase [Dehalococcoidia bacterium]
MTVRFRNDEAARVSGEAVGFSFGENWSKYLAGLNETKVASAEASLRRSFAGADFAGKRFIDVGSGSGLFSWCALRLGAASVLSIDADPNSVACAQRLRAARTPGSDWTVVRGSILERALVESLTPAPLVYSWGVLHHTGDLWRAVENTLALVAADGLCCLALYTAPNHVALEMACKRLYNRLPRALRPALVALYGARKLAGVALRGGNPIAHVRHYGQSSRGMSFWRDIEDWL